MITYRTLPTNVNNYPALIVGDRLQKAINYLHNTNAPFGTRGTKMADLEAVRVEAITLWELLWNDFGGIDNAEADRLRQEIRDTYENAVIRLRAKRGQTTRA